MGLPELAKLYQKHPLLGALKAATRPKDHSGIQIKGLFGSAFGLVLANIFEKQENNLIVLMPDKEEATYLHNDLEPLIPGNKLFFFPSSFRRDLTSPNDYKKSEGNTILRNKVIEAFNQGSNSLIISYPEALIEKEASCSTHEYSSFAIHKGEKI